MSTLHVNGKKLEAGLARWAALLGACASVFGCGKAIVDGVGTGRGNGGEGGGGGAAETTGGESTTTPAETTTSTEGEDFCADGVFVPGSEPGGASCPCEQSVGIHVDDGCGAYFLEEPYRIGTGCDMKEPFATATECKATYFTLDVHACNGPSKSPCLHMGVGKTPEGESSWGEWIDANGDLWTLTEVQMPGALPWSGPNAKGTFVATATRQDGATQQISGDYDVCISDAPVCPI